MRGTRFGFATDIKLACVNLGIITRLMLLPNYTSSMRATSEDWRRPSTPSI